MWINLASILVLSLLGHKSASQQLGLMSFTATMGSGKYDGTDDDVRVQLIGGENGARCTTGIIYYGGFYDSWSSGDTEQYLSTKQDFGSCKTFEANKSKVNFTIVKDGEDGLDLTKMEFHIGGEIYVWEGEAGWDPNHPIYPSLTAVCVTGNCLPVTKPLVCPNTGCPIANIRVMQQNGTDRKHCYFNGCPRATGTTGQVESGSTCVEMNRDLVQYKYCCIDPTVPQTQDLPTCRNGQNGENRQNGLNAQNEGNAQNERNGQNWESGQNGENGQNRRNGQYGRNETDY